MKVIFSELAEQELDDACLYYEAAAEGLGESFRSQIKAAIKRILIHPTSWAIERGDVRKHLLHRFPYKVLDSVETDQIFIIRIAHQHRRPDYWINRTSR